MLLILHICVCDVRVCAARLARTFFRGSDTEVRPMATNAAVEDVVQAEVLTFSGLLKSPTVSYHRHHIPSKRSERANTLSSTLVCVLSSL